MKNIVFIHGMFMNPKCWAEWVTYFSQKGYNCHTPAYPFHEGEPAELRKNIPAGLSSLTLDVVLQSIEKVVSKIDAPIAVGHSMGGLLTQLLVNKGLVKAGVCIDSAPPVGVFTLKWSF